MLYHAFGRNPVRVFASGTALAVDTDLDGLDDDVELALVRTQPFGAQQVISTLADSAVSVTAADLDNDGALDVLSASTNDDKIAWYRNPATDPTVAATDGGGLSDGVEVNTYATNPLASNRGDLGPRGAPDEITLGDLNSNAVLDTSGLSLLTRVILGIIPLP